VCSISGLGDADGILQIDVSVIRRYIYIQFRIYSRQDHLLLPINPCMRSQLASFGTRYSWITSDSLSAAQEWKGCIR